MIDVIGEVRQKLDRLAESAQAVRRLYETGFLDLTKPGVMIETAKNAPLFGPQATMAIQGGRKYAGLPALVDERGTLTYRQIDNQSWALARGLQSLGVTEGSVVGLLCRDHRGLILAMAACALWTAGCGPV